MAHLKNKGSALISALFIMTLVAIAATAMGVRLQLDIYRTQLLLNTDKLYLASQSVSFWAMNELKRKRPLNKVLNARASVAYFPKTLRNIYPGVSISGELIDLQSRLNLNTIDNKRYVPIFIKLLRQLDKHLSLEKQRDSVFALQQWLTPYDPNRGQDALLKYYRSQTPAYFPSHLPMQSASELRLVKGFSPKLTEALAPLVTVLPQYTPVNLNTADKPLLLALSNGQHPELIDELLEKRAQKPIKTIQDIQKIIDKTGIKPELITLESQYFLSIAKVTTEDLTLIHYSVFTRSKDKKGKNQVHLIGEKLNSL